MDIKSTINFFNTYKRGTYTRIVKQTNKDGFIKRVAMVCRFVNYYNIKSIKEQNKQPSKKEYERVILPHILKENTNTNNILLLVYVTNNNKQKAKTSYFYNNDPIIEAEYYEGIREKKRASAPGCVMSFKLCDVVSLGGSKNEKE